MGVARCQGSAQNGSVSWCPGRLDVLFAGWAKFIDRILLEAPHKGPEMKEKWMREGTGHYETDSKYAEPCQLGNSRKCLARAFSGPGGDTCAWAQPAQRARAASPAAQENIPKRYHQLSNDANQVCNLHKSSFVLECTLGVTNIPLDITTCCKTDIHATSVTAQAKSNETKTCKPQARG